MSIPPKDSANTKEQLLQVDMSVKQLKQGGGVATKWHSTCLTIQMLLQLNLWCGRERLEMTILDVWESRE